MTTTNNDNNNKKPIIINLTAPINLDGREIGRLTGKHILRNISGSLGLEISDIGVGDCGFK
jgi:hypothetical protein